MIYETPSWEKPTDIFWCVTMDGELFGYDTYAGAKSLAEFLGGHVEITRANGQMELFD